MDTQETINKLVDDIIAGNNTEARDRFDSALGMKITAAMDIKKLDLARSTYTQTEDGTEE